MSALLLVSLALAAPVPKAAAPELKWRFTKGDTFYLHYEREAETGLQMGGAAGAKTMSSVAVVFLVTVVAADANATVLEWECMLATQKVVAGGAAVAAAPPGQKPNLSAQKVRITLDGKQAVTSVEGGNALAKAAGGGASEILTDGMKYMTEQLLRSVPGKSLP